MNTSFTKFYAVINSRNEEIMDKKHILYRYILCLILLFTAFTSFTATGCSKKKNNQDIEAPTAKPDNSNDYLINTPSITNTVEEPSLTPEPSIEPDTKDSLLTFEKAAVTSKEGLPIPYMTKDSFPRMDGSTANIPLAEAIYQYLTGSTEEEAKEALSFNKTSGAYINLMNNDTDILIVYEPSQEVLKEMYENNVQLEFKPLGRDALVFIENENNPVDSLSGKQLYDIYTGNITNWSEVGGEDVEIKAFQRPSSSGSQTLMEKLVVPADEIMQGEQVVRPEEMGHLIDALAEFNNEHNALGYSVYFYAKNMYSKPGLKFIAVDGVMPASSTIQSGEYPYLNDFYVVIRKDEPEDSNARIIYDWLTTKEAQILISNTGYVPIIPVNSGETRLDETLIENFAKTINIKEDEYIIIKDLNAEGVIIGDYLIDKNLEVCLTFSGKRIIAKKSLTCKSDEILILESYVPYYSPYDNSTAISMGYELYDLKTNTYLTKQTYRSINVTINGYYICTNDINRQGGIYQTDYAVFRNDGKLLYSNTLSRSNNDDYMNTGITIVKDRVFVKIGNRLSVFDKNGTLINDKEYEYSYYLEQYNNEQSEYAAITIEVNNQYYYVLLDKDGNIASDEMFLRNTSFINDKPDYWILGICEAYDGKIYVKGLINGRYIIACEDGRVIYDNTERSDKISCHMTKYYFKEGINIYNYNGDLVNTSKQEIYGYGNMVLFKEDGLYAYNGENGESFYVKCDGSNVKMLVVEFNIPDSILMYYINNEQEDLHYTAYKDIKVFDGFVYAEEKDEQYFIMWSLNLGWFLIDKNGMTLYTAGENERLLNIIIGNEIYVYVEEGNYAGIKDLDGNFIYRKYASKLVDD